MNISRFSFHPNPSKTINHTSYSTISPQPITNKIRFQSSQNSKPPNLTKSDKIKHALGTAFEAAVSPLPIIRDGVIGLGLALLASCIPPHIHGVFLIPAVLGGGITLRAIRQFHRSYSQPDLNEIQKAKKRKDSGYWIF